jgi:hypothetical protein
MGSYRKRPVEQRFFKELYREGHSGDKTIVLNQFIYLYGQAEAFQAFYRVRLLPIDIMHSSLKR